MVTVININTYLLTYLIDHKNSIVWIATYGVFFSAKKMSPSYKEHYKNC